MASRSSNLKNKRKNIEVQPRNIRFHSHLSWGQYEDEQYNKIITSRRDINEEYQSDITLERIKK